MDAKTYDRKTAAFAGYIIQNIPRLTEATMDRWMKDPIGLKNFLSGLEPPEEPKAVMAKPRHLLSVIATTSLGATEGKKTSKCFVGPRYSYRDTDFDCLPANQPREDACVVTALAPAKNSLFLEWAWALLGADGSLQNPGALLVGRGYTLTLTQIEQLVELTERGEETGLRSDGWENCFFVETRDEKDPVLVGRVSQVNRVWRAHIERLGDNRRWSQDRVLVRNLSDAWTL